jgi:hypothetical protein
MAMTRRERMIATVTALAVAAFAADHYAITPYFVARAAVADETDKVSARLADAELKFNRQRRMEREWKAMLSGGLKADGGEAEQQMYEAVGDWAREAGVTLNTRDPQRMPRNDRTQIVRLRVTGTGTSAAVAKLMWRIEKAEIPLKVEEFTLNSRNQGQDDLAVTLVVSTIWIRPEAPAGDAARRQQPAPRKAPAGGE